ncbi:barstar family protein [Luteolibacter ambystomatis]|uniref:Barstar family protein n=1 Tax=Luteolibacter ambystomatis TaxID=2824561 RepID=A0A975IZ61_9BACT|nr:barstar family protein [Luteolibacter ambystomatis]QUE50849.1 barstar family protein [Luteolibacter ambystomatis]
MTDPWPFDQPRNCATFTTAGVIHHGEPIIRVYHDEDDHGWQFHLKETEADEKPLLVCLEHIVNLDPTVLEIADLPPGWMAWRASRLEPWNRRETWANAARIEIAWASFDSQNQFYDSIALQCGWPDWHGKNLDALRDSWVTGGIDTNGPPYVFRFQCSAKMEEDMKAFAEVIHQIAKESVSENGGSFQELGAL